MLGNSLHKNTCGGGCVIINKSLAANQFIWCWSEWDQQKKFDCCMFANKPLLENFLLDVLFTKLWYSLPHCMFYATQTINAIDEILRAFQKKLMFHCRAWFLWTDTCAGQRILYFRRFDRHQRWCICCFSKSLLKELKTYLVLLWQDQYPERQKQAASPAKGKEIEFTLFFSYSICSSWEISCPWEMSLKWVGLAEPVGARTPGLPSKLPSLVAHSDGLWLT